jgi:sugar lactone lactonase YvrE
MISKRDSNDLSYQRAGSGKNSIGVRMAERFSARWWIVLAVLAAFLSQMPAFARDNGASWTAKVILEFADGQVAGIALSEPAALTMDSEGNIFLVDAGNHRIIKFDKRGALLYVIGGFGWENQQFDQPMDASCKNGLDLYVADFNNERIERYDREMNYLSSYRPDESVPQTLQFGLPTSVDISRHGELFICDTEYNRILKLDAFGAPEISFGDYNWGDGKLARPVRLEVSRKDQIYVSDQGTDQIVVFDYYGNYITRFGHDILNDPDGLAISQDNLLFVADSGNDRVVVFDQQNRMLYQWGSTGNKLGAFADPVDLVLAGNLIYVLDAGNNRVQVFELKKERN